MDGCAGGGRNGGGGYDGSRAVVKGGECVVTPSVVIIHDPHEGGTVPS